MKFQCTVEYTTEVTLEVEAQDEVEASQRAKSLALVEGGSAPHSIVRGPEVVALVDL